MSGFVSIKSEQLLKKTSKKLLIRNYVQDEHTTHPEVLEGAPNRINLIVISYKLMAFG